MVGSSCQFLCKCERIGGLQHDAHRAWHSSGAQRALRARLADEVEQMKRGRAMMLAFAAAPSRSKLTAA
jgi:hypothetical protein